jgi:hypothetical protein
MLILIRFSAARRKGKRRTIKSNADHGSVCGHLLKDGADLMTVQELAHERRTLGRHISHHHATLTHDLNGLGIDRVLRLGNELHRIAWAAESDLEKACWAALVLELSAYDGDGKAI